MGQVSFSCTCPIFLIVGTLRILSGGAAHGASSASFFPQVGIAIGNPAQIREEPAFQRLSLISFLNQHPKTYQVACPSIVLEVRS